MTGIKGKSIFHIAGWRHAACLFLLWSLVTLAHSAESPGTPKASENSQHGNGAPSAFLFSSGGMVSFVRPPPSYKAELEDSEGELFEEAFMENDEPTAIYKGKFFRDHGVMKVTSIHFTGYATDRKETARKLIESIVERAFDKGLRDLTVRTSSEELSLAEVMGEKKFFLDNYKPSKRRADMGHFDWHVFLPEKRKFFPDHRYHLNEELAAKLSALKHSGILPFDQLAPYLTVLDKERYDQLFVTPAESAEPVERHRAARFMAQRKLGSRNPLEQNVTLSKKHTNSRAYIASTKHDLIVMGVLTGWISDKPGMKKEGYVQFLGATDTNEACTKAALLVEFLTDCREAKVAEVVLNNVPLYDIATVSVALELGFTIKKRTEDGYQMVRSGKEPVKDLDAIVYTRKLVSELKAVENASFRAFIVPTSLAEAFDAMGANIDVNKDLINERARDFFLYAGATVAVFALVELFLKLRKARRRRATAKRLRETKMLNDDRAQHREQSIQEPAEVETNAPLSANSFLH